MLKKLQQIKSRYKKIIEMKRCIFVNYVKAIMIDWLIDYVERWINVCVNNRIKKNLILYNKPLVAIYSKTSK